MADGRDNHLRAYQVYFAGLFVSPQGDTDIGYGAVTAADGIAALPESLIATTNDLQIHTTSKSPRDWAAEIQDAGKRLLSDKCYDPFLDLSLQSARHRHLPQIGP